MTSLRDPRALITFALILFGLVWIVRKQDPVELSCRWLFAFRRAVWIFGTMLRDSVGEFRHRWMAQRGQDAAALAKLSTEFPAGTEESIR